MNHQKKKTILVIEDQQAIRANLLKILKHVGFQTISAENGLEGMELAKNHLPDLIICDIMMPDIDGHDVLKELLQDPGTARIPFIFLTAKADRSDIREGMNLGADDYLTKPFTSDELINTVFARLAKQEAITQPYLEDMKRATDVLEEVAGNIKQAVDQVSKLSYRDSLTNLPNRKALLHWLPETLSEAQDKQQQVAVLLLNLDNFRSINTNFGQGTGDLLLKAVVERLQNVVSEENAITHIGGDEFCLIQVGVLQKQNAAKLARNLLNSITQPYSLNGKQVSVKTSIGIAVYPDDGQNPDQLLTAADQARRSCRMRGGGNYRLYSSLADSVNDPSLLR
ncbi:MAG: diguanylate cyclase [Symploca sp. SIO2C1]|nr:diguanylate cyclase [Symploca sp. SIO2C1]